MEILRSNCPFLKGKKVRDTYFFRGDVECFEETDEIAGGLQLSISLQNDKFIVRQDNSGCVYVVPKFAINETVSEV